MNQTSIDFLSPVSTTFVLALIAAAIMGYLSVRLSSGSANTLSRRWPIYVLRGLFMATLCAVLFNPVRVTERSGAIEPSQVFVLLDASESMAIGDESNTRWDEAIGKIKDEALRKKMAKQQRDIIMALPEIDGCFVDSHELGRVYGTAMALLSLADCSE